MTHTTIRIIRLTSPPYLSSHFIKIRTRAAWNEKELPMRVSKFLINNTLCADSSFCIGLS
jgi:hypothetical protein